MATRTNAGGPYVPRVNHIPGFNDGVSVGPRYTPYLSGVASITIDYSRNQAKRGLLSALWVTRSTLLLPMAGIVSRNASRVYNGFNQRGIVQETSSQRCLERCFPPSIVHHSSSRGSTARGAKLQVSKTSQWGQDQPAQTRVRLTLPWISRRPSGREDSHYSARNPGH